MKLIHIKRFMRELLPLYQAAAEGKTIQYQNAHGTWSDYTCSIDPDDFDVVRRIKPEPNLRPWKPEEVPLGALIRSKQEAKSQVRWLIVGHDHADVAISNNGCSRTFAYCLDAWEHSTDNGKTWLPCGVLEDA
jgi:hypothetical protein